MADEAVAEAFAQAGGEMERIRNLKSWLYSVAFRIARKELKHRHRGTISADLVPTADATEPTAAPEAVLDLMRELRRLSPRQRGVLVLRDAMGYSTRETAGTLRISEVAVRVHLHAARRRLRDRLGGVEVL